MNIKILGLLLLFLSMGAMAFCTRNMQTGAIICSENNSHTHGEVNVGASTPGANISVDVNFQSTTKQIVIQNKENEIEVSQGESKVIAKKPIAIKNVNGKNKIFIRSEAGMEIGVNVAPEVAVNEIRNRAVRERMRINESKVEIDVEGNTPVYKTVAVKRGRFLGIIPVDVSVDVAVNAQSGEVKTRMPFWSFLIAFG